MKQSVCNVLAILPFAMACAAATFASDAYPSHPIRLVVNTGPGGLVDFTTRLIARELNLQLKQQVVAALFLASDEANFITGVSVLVDGGRILNRI
ncbi:hypothetical protein [Cupriavidus sp. D39]|uniref:hypothetical protein n=1 Tax=Cupriavidus sp. D39 TaxID=2997877 RepID=UPI002271C29C|nr:hypothetical protein [Cupriavidus sp. D39]MCY0853516.1 hypothetical protein [Cupriavidus sp. D39]